MYGLSTGNKWLKTQVWDLDVKPEGFSVRELGTRGVALSGLKSLSSFGFRVSGLQDMGICWGRESKGAVAAKIHRAGCTNVRDVAKLRAWGAGTRMRRVRALGLAAWGLGGFRIQGLWLRASGFRVGFRFNPKRLKPRRKTLELLNGLRRI